MKLIFIYGPPASGKLTVGEELSELTGIPLFHNHLTRDIVKEIYADKLEENYDLVNELRFKVFEYCARHDTDLIFTSVYSGAEDDEYIRKYISKIESYGATISYVELTATRDDLINRVDNDSRKQFKKLMSKEVMKEIIKDTTVFSIPFVSSLKVSTSVMSAHQSARYIAKKLNLLGVN